VREARRHCRATDGTVRAFKAAMGQVHAACAAIAAAPLADVQKRKLYEHEEFAAVQAEHQAAARERLARAAADVQASLASARVHFQGDGDEVQREWAALTCRVDERLHAALRSSVHASLAELARVLVGDARSPEVLPLFRATMVLDERSGRVELRPTLQAVFDTVQHIVRELVAVLRVVPRMSAPLHAERPAPAAAGLSPPPPPLPSFYDLVSADEEATLRTIVRITTGVTAAAQPAQAALEHFEKRYQRLYDADKDAYVRRYARARKPLSSFEADLAEYSSREDEVAHEASTANVRFLFVDCAPLKHTLTGHCMAWRSKLLGLLASKASTELAAVRDGLAAGAAALASPSLPELEGAHKRLLDERVDTLARLELIRCALLVVFFFCGGAPGVYPTSGGGCTHTRKNDVYQHPPPNTPQSQVSRAGKARAAGVR
jgi:dynein heavy chain